MLSYGVAIVTSEQLAVVTSAVNENVAVILPVGLGILAVLVGVALIPKIVSKFMN